ncbi:hypothetical protein Avbf_13195 [Armadillidium vulgare]|nr:hypothetical protein Avbf_13195 [Armadillidium vulgare]
MNTEAHIFRTSKDKRTISLPTSAPVKALLVLSNNLQALSRPQGNKPYVPLAN